MGGEHPAGRGGRAKDIEAQSLVGQGESQRAPATVEQPLDGLEECDRVGHVLQHMTGDQAAEGSKAGGREPLLERTAGPDDIDVLDASGVYRRVAGVLRDEIRATGMIDDGRSPPSRFRGQRLIAGPDFDQQVIAGQAGQEERCAIFHGDGPGPALRASGRRQIEAKPTWSIPVRDHPTRTVFPNDLPSMGDRIGTPFALSVQWLICRVWLSRCADVLVFQHHCVIAGSKTRKTARWTPGFSRGDR